MRNDDFDRRMSVIVDNDNVEKTNEVGNLFVLISGIVGIFLFIVLSLSTLEHVYIDLMPVQTKCKVEEALSYGRIQDERVIANYSKQQRQLEYLKQIIIQNDDELRQYSNIRVAIIDSEKYNAWVYPNGDIYFTTALIDEIYTKEELTFILAHEIGHYKNRDALKSISKDVISMAASMMMGIDSNTYVQNIVSNTSFFESIVYSKNVERKADIYSAKMLKKLYGNTDGAISVFKKLEKKAEYSKFAHYFSSHPSPQERIEYIQKI